MTNVSGNWKTKHKSENERYAAIVYYWVKREIDHIILLLLNARVGTLKIKLARAVNTTTDVLEKSNDVTFAFSFDVRVAYTYWVNIGVG